MTTSRLSSNWSCPDRRRWAPGATPLERLIAYGRARAGFMIGRRDIARAALDGSQPTPVGPRTPRAQIHLRMLLAQLSLGGVDLDMLTVQLAAALDGHMLRRAQADPGRPATLAAAHTSVGTSHRGHVPGAPPVRGIAVVQRLSTCPNGCLRRVPRGEDDPHALASRLCGHHRK
jgi:hypothetical protein